MGGREEADSDDPRLAESFGRCVTRHREAAGLPMIRLAAMAGMSRAYIWRIEQGQTLPSLRNVARLAVALDLSVSALLEGLDLTGVTLENRPYQSDG